MEAFDDFDVGSNDLIQEALREIPNDGYDCDSVALLLRLAKDGDLVALADVLGGLLAASHPDWVGDILKMVIMQKAKGQEPDYTTPAWVLTYLVDTNPEAASQLCPNLLTFGPQGPDCYDLAFILGHMARTQKAAQAAKLLMALYGNDSPENVGLKSLVPFVLGTLIDYQHVDWALALVEQMCTAAGRSQPNYAMAGWCLAQHVFYQRPDWAAALCGSLLRQHSAWYSQASMMQSVASWGGDGYAQQIVAAMSSGPAARRN